MKEQITEEFQECRKTRPAFVRLVRGEQERVDTREGITHAIAESDYVMCGPDEEGNPDTTDIYPIKKEKFHDTYTLSLFDLGEDVGHGTITAAYADQRKVFEFILVVVYSVLCGLLGMGLLQILAQGMSGGSDGSIALYFDYNIFLISIIPFSMIFLILFVILSLIYGRLYPEEGEA